MSAHLTESQLASLIDGAVEPRDREALERHVADCAECRELIEALTGQDRALASALAHDPGERYFETFAPRVMERIARETTPAAAAASGGASRWTRWFASPRTLATVGGALALVAVAAVVLLRPLPDTTKLVGDAQRAAKQAPTSSERTSLPESQAAPPPEATAPMAPLADAVQPPAEEGLMKQKPQANAPPEAGLDKTDSPTIATQSLKGRRATMGRSQEVREDANGEPVPVARDERDALTRSNQGVRTPSGIVKPRATPMAGAAAPVAEKAAAKESPADAERSFAAAPPSRTREAPLQVETKLEAEASQGLVVVRRGVVRDRQGRAVAGAQVIASGGRQVVRTDADGAFELPADVSGPLRVLALGYVAHESSLGTAGGGSIDVTLEPVETLGPVAAMKRLKNAEPPTAALSAPEASADQKSGAKSANALELRTPRVPPTSMAANVAVTRARQQNTLTAWNDAALAWQQVIASGAKDVARRDALLGLAEARVASWRLERSRAGARTAALQAIDRFLAEFPRGADADSARGWRREVAQP